MVAIGNIDEKYVKESEKNTMRSPIIRTAVCLCVVVALGLYLFLPFAPVTSNLTAYSGSDYFPLIESIEDYRLTFLQPKYKNNFEGLAATFGGFMEIIGNGIFRPQYGGSNGGDMAPESPGNGSYVENTDNQVSGVIESDLMKMTDKYIFRLGYRFGSIEVENGKPYNSQTSVLRVYSVDKENSAIVAEYDIPMFENEFWKSNLDGEMFLSLDGKTVTLLKNYTDEQTNTSKLGIISIDVSDVNNIKTRAMVSVDGSLNTSRMVDGKMLVISEYYFNRNRVDYNDPATFVPSISTKNGSTPISFDDIIFPETVGNTRYSVVGLFDSDSLELLGASALLNFAETVYVSENNVYVTREYSDIFEVETNEYHQIKTNVMTDVAVLDYSGDKLEKKGVITMKGSIEDQYSLDEKDGYLRAVASIVENEGFNGAAKQHRNASLYIFDLKDNSLAYSLEDFAIEGEEATAVRFDGDMVYVCTAVKITFTDPVYFIDLSDYEKIESADTGIIEGFSDHLIDLGDGFLLGIGQENWENKIEIYEQRGDKVVSLEKFMFEGRYSTEYKSYLVNREKNLFGFGVDNLYIMDEQTGRYDSYGDAYILLQFNGYELSYKIIQPENSVINADTVRAVYLDGYLYITTPYGITVERID